MNESFLWYLWKYRLYSHDLATTDGEPITVEHPGYQNQDSGPDFSNALIRIGNTLWAGNVEVHTRASDWHRHGHQHDKAFDNVILHVVYEADETVTRNSGQVIPVVELKKNIDPSRWNSYRQLMKSAMQIPCEKQVGKVDDFVIKQWLDRTLVTRLERKTEYINKVVALYKGSWEDAFYQVLANNFGFKVNALPFELLARSLPLKVLLRHNSNLLQVEAMLFGQAGLLDAEFEEAYPKQLQKEYIYLKAKLNLQNLEAKLWKFARMHPANFPTVRISQFAGLIFNHPHLFPEIAEAKDIRMLMELLSAKAGPYWDVHYVFDKVSSLSQKSLGQSAIQNIIINTIVPLLFTYGKKNDAALCDRAIQWLDQCEAENNSIIRAWMNAGVKVSSASQSQALIELKNEYCLKKNCLNCGIGLKLLQQNE